MFNFKEFVQGRTIWIPIQNIGLDVNRPTFQKKNTKNSKFWTKPNVWPPGAVSPIGEKN